MVPQLEQMYFARCIVLKGALSKENEPLISSELCVAELAHYIAKTTILFARDRVDITTVRNSREPSLWPWLFIRIVRALRWTSVG